MTETTISVSLVLSCLALVLALFATDTMKSVSRKSYIIFTFFAALHLPWYTAKVWLWGFISTLLTVATALFLWWLAYILLFTLEYFFENQVRRLTKSHPLGTK